MKPDKSLFENYYYNTYYYANIIDNILRHDSDTIGFINLFHERYSPTILKPFQKVSAFHCFIRSIVTDFFLDDMDNYNKSSLNEKDLKHPSIKLYAEPALLAFDLNYPFKDFCNKKDALITWADIESYNEELTITGHFEELFARIADEVFYILFGNRHLLLRFNLIMAFYVQELKSSEIEEEVKPLFKLNKTLLRKSIPEWSKKATFFRDRGHCCNCGKDLTNITSRREICHYDHIIPLKQGGINDVSNLQLLCSDCNLKKGGKNIYTSSLYEKWY